MSKNFSPESARNIAELATDLLTLLANPQVTDTMYRVILDESEVLRVNARQTALAFVDHRPAPGIAGKLGLFVNKAEIFLANSEDRSTQNFLCDFYRELYQIVCAVKVCTYRAHLYRNKRAEVDAPIKPSDTNSSLVRLAHLLERYADRDLKAGNREIYTKAAATSRSFSSLAPIDQLEESQRVTEEFFKK